MIVPAAGVGRRLGGGVKALVPLAGRARLLREGLKRLADGARPDGDE